MVNQRRSISIFNCDKVKLAPVLAQVDPLLIVVYPERVKHDYQTRVFGRIYILCKPEPKEQGRAYKVAR